MARLGMDDVLVEQIGNKLKSIASGDIAQLISTIESQITLAVSNWDGKDEQDCQGDWQQQQKPALTNLQHAIDGLAQSALNNVTEQRSVSGH